MPQTSAIKFTSIYYFRFCDIREGLNDTAANLLSSISNSESEVSPSTMFAVASILEGCCFINGSPQNTFVPGVIELAQQCRVYIAGDDFKSGKAGVKLLSARNFSRAMACFNKY